MSGSTWRNKHPQDMSQLQPEHVLLYVHGATWPSEATSDLTLEGYRGWTTSPGRVKREDLDWLAREISVAVTRPYYIRMNGFPSVAIHVETLSSKRKSRKRAGQ